MRRLKNRNYPITRPSQRKEDTHPLIQEVDAQKVFCEAIDTGNDANDDEELESSSPRPGGIPLSTPFKEKGRHPTSHPRGGMPKNCFHG
ncbi:hypothetical protein [Absidia glauca]|uniref:Uncharacterized protein n=1 Tax=Absidia glauca TaxID=4829 RepID=A0A163K2M6_ABSGL|nr:hypothetical protein [Absidia glauca]SAM01503.1 hypothetical protein [Absidia glauca]SAM05125.1 hypothetical protein [Absidia glauca]